MNRKLDFPTVSLRPNRAFVFNLMVPMLTKTFNLGCAGLLLGRASNSV
jgi:hypothetical protein